MIKRNGHKTRHAHCHNLFLNYSKKVFCNNVVLNDTVFLLPLHTQRQGKEKFCSPVPLFPPTCINFNPWPITRQKKKKETSPSGGPEATAQ